MSDDGVHKRAVALGEEVTRLRHSRDWNVNACAARALIAPMTWRRLEDGRPVRRRTLVALDRFLDVPVGSAQTALTDDDRLAELLHLMQERAPSPPLSPPDFDDDLAAVVRVMSLARPGASPAVEALVRAAVAVMPELVAARQARGETA